MKARFARPRPFFDHPLLVENASTLLVLLIGLSRMYLGVHYPSDVAAGYAARSLWLSALITAMDTVRRGKQGSELR